MSNDSIKGKKCDESVDDEEKKSIKLNTKRVNKPITKFPLKDKNYMGYLNSALEKFIQYNSQSICYENPPENDNLKKDVSCLLRHGVNNNVKQSFLEAIATVSNMTLSQFKQFLLKKITIEKFMTAFDGGLIDLFETDDVLKVM